MKKIITFIALLTLTAGAWAADEASTTDDTTTTEESTDDSSSSSTYSGVEYTTSNYILDEDQKATTSDKDSIGNSSTSDDGTTTYTSSWWTAFSYYYMIPKGYTLTLSFTNHCNENGKPVGGEYHNVTALMVTSNNVRGDSNEFIGLTNTSYCWKASSDNHFSTGFPSDTTEMMKALNGATMIVKVARPSDEDSVYVTMEAKSSDGETLMTQQTFNTTEDSCKYLRAYLVVDSAMVTNLKSELKEGVDTSIDDGYPYPYISNGGQEVTSVGSSGYNTGWWSAFSSYYRIPTGYTLTLNYKVQNDGQGHSSGYYDTSLMVASDGTRYNHGYSEAGGVTVTDSIWNINSDDHFSYGYPSTLTESAKKLNGATVEMKIANDSDKVIITTTAFCTNDTLTQRINDNDIPFGEVIRAFLAVEEDYVSEITSSLSKGIDTEVSAGSYPYISNGGDEVTEAGSSSYTGGWWVNSDTTFTSYYLVPSGYELEISFTNHCDPSASAATISDYTSTGQCTALMVTHDVSQSDRRDTGVTFTEFVGLSDTGFEWINYNSRNYTIDSVNIKSDTNLSSVLNGAKITVTVSNFGTSLTAKMVAVKGDTTMTQTVSTTIDEQIVRAFMVPSNSYIDTITSTLSHVSYTRTNSSTSAYGTICLPYDATAEGATIYHVVGYGATTTTSDDGTTTETPSELYLEEVTEMEAGKGYVFCTTSKDTVVSFTMTSSIASEAVGDTLVGNLSTESLAVPDTCYILASTVSDGTTSYYWGNGTGNTVAQYRAYLNLGVFTETTPEATAAKKGWLSMSLAYDGDDGTTGIKEIATEEQSRYDDDAFYNLSGVRVTNPQKGIYIRNGKKYIFK